MREATGQAASHWRGSAQVERRRYIVQEVRLVRHDDPVYKVFPGREHRIEQHELLNVT